MKTLLLVVIVVVSILYITHMCARRFRESFLLDSLDSLFQVKDSSEEPLMWMMKTALQSPNPEENGASYMWEFHAVREGEFKEA